jgi:hypothetical protein
LQTQRARQKVARNRNIRGFRSLQAEYDGAIRSHLRRLKARRLPALRNKRRAHNERRCS